ncbi:hypothetical protein B0H67DRAFT_136888 [Lasiosphaeris hirsuta]|uniref:HNH nuclease domain-containing protein n=1 Tax=Lasiosphaeris hirsuta TaxID=260670 RepID=A0AA40E2M1_9PEZI|nr:hypothetical protein B0H67DRAFT_136888 [Lasiosphaeris hirsuta]
MLDSTVTESIKDVIDIFSTRANKGDDQVKKVASQLGSGSGLGPMKCQLARLTGTSTSAKKRKTDPVGDGADEAEYEPRENKPKPNTKGDRVKTSIKKYKETRREPDGRAYVVLKAANPEVCHIIPRSANSTDRNRRIFSSALVRLHYLEASDIFQEGWEEDDISELLSNELGCSDRPWNMICLNRQLHD